MKMTKLELGCFTLEMDEANTEAEQLIEKLKNKDQIPSAFISGKLEELELRKEKINQVLEYHDCWELSKELYRLWEIIKNINAVGLAMNCSAAQARDLARGLADEERYESPEEHVEGTVMRTGCRLAELGLVQLVLRYARHHPNLKHWTLTSLGELVAKIQRQRSCHGH